MNWRISVLCSVLQMVTGGFIGYRVAAGLLVWSGEGG